MIRTGVGRIYSGLRIKNQEPQRSSTNEQSHPKITGLSALRLLDAKP